MAVAVLKNTLTEDLLHDSHSYDIPEDIYEEKVVPLLKEFTKFGIEDPSSVQFDPSKHIIFTDDYYEKTKKLTLEDLAVTETHQTPISRVGVSEPFPLFSDEAIAIMRWELFQKECFLKCGRMADQIGKTANKFEGDVDIYVRGFTKEYAPFSHQAWTHPKVYEIINTMAEVELELIYGFETAHANVSIRQPNASVTSGIAPAQALSSEIDYETPEDIPAVVSWHYDSPQFVCVLMMSDTENMIGGETFLRKGDGKIAKVANPKKGWANVLQGRILRHMAPKPKGVYSERITSVSGYRPKDPMLDRCAMSTTKPASLASSRYNAWYKDWMNYRLEVLAKRVKILQDQINTKIDSGELFDQIETINFLQNKIVEYAEHTWQEFEVVDDGLVEKPKSFQLVKARWDDE